MTAVPLDQSGQVIGLGVRELADVRRFATFKRYRTPTKINGKAGSFLKDSTPVLTTHTFNVQIEPQMVRQAWNAWFFKGRRMGRLGAAGLLFLAAIFMDGRDGRFSSISVVSATLLAFTFLIYVVVYVVGIRRALDKLDSIIDGKASYTLTEDIIEARSSLGAFALAWSAIIEIRCYRDFVLLIFRGGSYSTIPTTQIPDPALAFLLERVKANGGKITALSTTHPQLQDISP